MQPIFAALAPGVVAATRTSGRSGEATGAEQGYLHCGPAGAGHFVKMVHNGIEYGLMAAYAEGLNILRHADVGRRAHATDAERRRCAMPTSIATSSISRRSPRSGAAAASSPLAARLDRRRVAGIRSSAPATGASRLGRGPLDAAAAIDEAVPVHVLAAAVFERFDRAARPLSPPRALGDAPCVRRHVEKPPESAVKTGGMTRRRFGRGVVPASACQTGPERCQP